MDPYKCPICNKRANEPINLRCDHHPCFQCASQIICVDQQSILQSRYRIICPACNTKTITYDLRHLIINNTQQDQELFVTSKFISKKPEVLAKRNCSNEKSKGTNIKRASFQGIINIYPLSKQINIHCKKHIGCNIHYFCEQCCQKNYSDAFLCSQCLKSHKHRVFNVRQAGQKIQLINQKKRQAIPSHRNYLEETLVILTSKKQTINVQFETLYKQIAEQFKILYNYINQQFQITKKELKSIYMKQSQQIRNNIAFVQKLKQNLMSLQKINSQNRYEIQTQVNYMICLGDIENVIQTGKSKFNDKIQIPKIKKRTSLILGSNQNLFQIQTCKPKNISKPATPTNSNLVYNYNFQQPRQISKNQLKIQSRLDDTNSIKENFNPLSPKNFFTTSKFNI